MLREWEKLPEFMQIPEMKVYYDILKKRKISLVLKRGFDIIISMLLILFLAIPMIIIAIVIVVDSPGGAIYKQERITAYGKKFRIYKFRTMVSNADKIGAHVTINNDSRITKVGKKIRSYRLDELPQLFNVLTGDMSFVGTRPEAIKYVKQYTKEMYATLLLPAGITSEASIRYKDEAILLDGVEDVDRTYLEKVLPEKMKYNLKSMEQFSFLGEMMIMVRTVFAVLGKEYK